MRKRMLTKIYIFLLLYLLLGGSVSARERIDSLMTELHRTIQNREIYESQKENRLKALRLNLYSAHDDNARFGAMGELLDEFRPYNTDSAFAYCKLRENLALKTGNPEFITNAQLNTANVLGSIGILFPSISCHTIIILKGPWPLICWIIPSEMKIRIDIEE